MSEPHFNGPEYKSEADHDRLANQHERVKACMEGGPWRTLEEISEITGDPVASISAQLRHLRKKRFGSRKIERRARGNRDSGLFEYRMGPEEKNEGSLPTKRKSTLYRRAYELLCKEKYTEVLPPEDVIEHLASSESPGHLKNPV